MKQRAAAPANVATDDRYAENDDSSTSTLLAEPLLHSRRAARRSASSGRDPFSWSKFWAFTGPGWLMSMAYLDPGNLEADLQSGAYARYELLYVVLLSTIAGGCYQVLAARLGTCTGKHLAQHCRAEYPRSVSLALWVMTELAIIGSDIQEVLGSAIAFKILFGLPLYAGCLITGLDTFTFLALHRAGASGQGSRVLELFFMALITAMCVCFFVDFTVSKPSGIEILEGVFVPRLKEQNEMTAVAMLGAIIMPHNIFLHSALVQVRGIDTRNTRAVRDATFYFSLEAAAALGVSFLINAAVICVFASSFYSTACAALSTATNSISSLAGTGVQTSCVPLFTAMQSGNPIYDAVSGNVCAFNRTVTTALKHCTPCFVDGHTDLVTASATWRQEPTAGYCQEIGLAEAGEAVRESLGAYAKVVWAIGLLASGQASTMTGTYAGQFVMEGFLDLRIAAWKRVALTRGVALVPALVVAVVSQQPGGHAFHSDKLNEWLNVLQSVQLPFALLPLLAFTSRRELMGRAFVNSRAVKTLLLVGTGLLCGVNYVLVYRMLTKALPSNVPFSGMVVLCCVALAYVLLLLYLVLFSPTTNDVDALLLTGDTDDEDEDESDLDDSGGDDKATGAVRVRGVRASQV